MNRYIAAEETIDVHASLYRRAKSPLCVCGKEKRYGCFCDPCRDLLYSVIPRVSWRIDDLLNRGPHLIGLWLYDVCSDLLADPNIAIRKRRKKDHE